MCPTFLIFVPVRVSIATYAYAKSTTGMYYAVRGKLTLQNLPKFLLGHHSLRLQDA
jgi:hypothetical protein